MFEVFDEMIAREIMPDLYTFNNMILGCSNCGDLEAATELLKLMECMNIERNEYIYNAYLR